jgi:hypothetical protein
MENRQGLASGQHGDDGCKSTIMNTKFIDEKVMDTRIGSQPW